jgi:three-Cys-motif partner protein
LSTLRGTLCADAHTRRTPPLTPKTKTWKLEPHTEAKHRILRVYLQGWLPTISYGLEQRVLVIDGFCGPGEYEGGEDGSPVIALNALKNHTGIDLSTTTKKFTFVFLDENDDRIDHLKDVAIPTRVGPLPSSVEVLVDGAEFAPTVSDILDNLDAKGQRLAPSLVFVDPFGWKGVPMSLMHRLLQQPKCEVLVTFMVDSVNRFLEHPTPALRQTITDLFGGNQWQSIAQEPDRYDKLRELYERQLGGRYVRSFRMMSVRGRPVYDLVFSTNHIQGLKKMKAAMWEVDPQKGGSFDDREALRQPTLFDEAGVAFDPPAFEPLDAALLARFAGRSVGVAEVEEFVVVDTIFRETHYKKRLKKLEEEGKIVCIDRPGKKRNRGTYPPGTEIKFL